jgi:hypothetical protein
MPPRRLEREALESERPWREGFAFTKRPPHGDQGHLGKATRLLHKDGRRNLHEPLPRIESSAIGTTEQQGNRRPQRGRSAQGFNDYAAPQPLSPTRGGDDYAADADDRHDRRMTDLNLGDDKSG